MSFLDGFALLVLITLVVTFLALWIALGMMPGRIARKRKHPQADAINVCGWCGVITMGLLLPLAYIWAYSNSQQSLLGRTADMQQDKQDEEGAPS